MTDPVPQQIIVNNQAPPTNGLGTAGFIVSLAGLLLTCGLLCPIGLLLSFFALFKAPRGMAIAGFVIGLIGSAWVAFFGFAFVMGLVGIGEAQNVVTTMRTMQEARDAIEQQRFTSGELPPQEDGDAIVGQIFDGWGTALQYVPTETDFVIRSAGRDLQFDTADDLSNPSPR